MFNASVKTSIRVAVGIFAVLALGTFCFTGTINAADECRVTPGTQTSPGGHWRYRLEKGSGRKCWYLSGDIAKAAPVKPADGVQDNGMPAEEETTTAPVPLPTAKPKTARIESSVADARAELTRKQPEAKPSTDSAPLERSTPLLIDRWPTPKAIASVETSPAPLTSIAPPAPPTQPAVTLMQPQSRPQTDDADVSPMRILLAAAVGVLALVAILLRTIATYVNKHERRTTRRPIWDDAYSDQRSAAPIRRGIRTPLAPYSPDPFVVDDSRYKHNSGEDEIELLLRRAARRAAR